MYERLSKLGIVAVSSLLLLLAAVPVIAEEDGERHRHERRIEIRSDSVSVHQGRVFLGVQLMELTKELRIHFGVPEHVGVMVSKVVAETPAERAGVRVGDIITRVNGEDVESASRLARMIRSHDDGEIVDVEVWREGSIEMLAATLEQRPRRGDE